MRIEVFLVVLAVSSVCGKRIRSSLNNGTDAIENFIVGGVNAEDGAAPYQISLQTLAAGHRCGGAILNERWIATASHCIIDYIVLGTYKNLLVMTGSNKLSEPGPIYGVEEAYVHCNYNNPNYAYDIGLLKLNSSIVFNEKTAKIDLPVKPLVEGDELVLTGWGSIEPYGDSPDELQTVTLNYVPHEKCVEQMEHEPWVHVSHICTFTRAGEGSCHGDSGGPLVHNGYLYGLVNWGEPCAVGYPDMQANVFFFLDWIRRHVDGCNGW